MASIAVDDRLGDTAKQLVNHDSLVILGDRVEGLLYNMATEWVHREVQSVPTDCFRNLDDLLRSAMLEAALDKKVAKAIDHERVGLGYDGLNNLVLLFRGTDLELLLQEDRSLLVVVADDLVHDVFPVAVHITIEETAVVQRLSRGQVRRTVEGNHLFVLA